VKVSIALATYNGESYLHDQLQSYLEQYRQPDEIVVCDDCSNDGTLEILEAFRASAPFMIRIFQNPCNIGYTKNFEKAMSLCTGDIIFFSDQDDIWLPNKIRAIEKLFESYGDKSLIVHDGAIVDAATNSTGLTKLGQIRSGGLSDDSFVTGTLSALKRDILGYVLPFPKGITGGHDGWVHAIGRMLNRRLVVDDVLQKLRRHSLNTSDWVASSTTKISWLDVSLSQFKSETALSYSDRLHYNDSLSQRISRIQSGHNPSQFHVDFESIHRLLDREKQSILRREGLLACGFWARRASAVSMFLRGDYKHFNGFKSFARDLLRPK